MTIKMQGQDRSSRDMKEVNCQFMGPYSAQYDALTGQKLDAEFSGARACG